MTPDEFIAAVALRMRSSRCDIMPFDPRVEDEPRPAAGRAPKKVRKQFSIGHGPFVCRRWTIGLDEVDESDVKNVCRYLPNWWNGILWEESMLDAAWLYHGTGTPRSYLVDAVADRHLAAKGVSWSDFADHVSDVTGVPHPGMGESARQSHHNVWNTALRTYPRVPEDFMGGYYRTSIDLSTGRLAVLGNTQFKLACNGRRNLRMDIQIAPGVTWMSSSNPTIMVNQHFPDAICQGVRGRHVTEVIGANVLDVPGLVIKSMRHDGKRTNILLADIRIDIADQARPALALAA